MLAKPRKLSDQIREAMDASGRTRYQISQETGIDQATLSRFMSGKGGLSIPVLNTLAEYLGLRIVADKPQHKMKGR